MLSVLENTPKLSLKSTNDFGAIGQEVFSLKSIFTFELDSTLIFTSVKAGATIVFLSKHIFSDFTKEVYGILGLTPHSPVTVAKV